MGILYRDPPRHQPRLRPLRDRLSGKLAQGSVAQKIGDAPHQERLVARNIEGAALQPGAAAAPRCVPDDVLHAVDHQFGAIGKARHVRQRCESLGDPNGMFVQQSHPRGPRHAQGQRYHHPPL